MYFSKFPIYMHLNSLQSHTHILTYVSSSFSSLLSFDFCISSTSTILRVFSTSSFRVLVRFLSFSRQLCQWIWLRILPKNTDYIYFVCRPILNSICLASHTIATHSTKIPQRIFCDILYVIELSHILEQMVFCSVL